MTKECPHCGAKSPDEVAKCQWCGKEFSDSMEKIPTNILSNNGQKIDEKHITQNGSDTKNNIWYELKDYWKKIGQGDEQQPQGRPKGIFVRDESKEIDAILIRLMQRDLNVSDCYLFAIISALFLSIIFMEVCPDLFSQYGTSVFMKILVFCLAISITFLIFGWFFTKNKREILILGYSIIVGACIASFISYLFDKIIGFNKASLPPPDAVEIDPGTYPGIIVGFVTAYIAYKIMVGWRKK
jgi:hypothetical protein